MIASGSGLVIRETTVNNKLKKYIYIYIYIYYQYISLISSCLSTVDIMDIAGRHGGMEVNRFEYIYTSGSDLEHIEYSY